MLPKLYKLKKTQPDYKYGFRRAALFVIIRTLCLLERLKQLLGIGGMN